MTKFHIMGDNFEKEEKWINSWIKKGYRLKQGHRQQFTRVMINKIRTTAQKKADEGSAESTEA